ncbi:MAG: DUF2304 domain-containing protein [Ruminococcaceae bacterium]|nr:DUF2304 domain-containing protein [Oscillospiraceae bacterium]
MSLPLQIFLIVCVLVFFLMILRYLIKRKLNLKYTLIWLAAALVMLVIAIFPQIINFLCSLIGIQTPANAVFFFAIIFLFCIVMMLTAIVSHMNIRVYRNTQMQAILEKRVRELEKKLEEYESKE